MMRLIGYEFKKIFTRRILWIAAALGLALMGVVYWKDMLDARLSGQVQGMRDVYARYEGRVMTEAVAAEAQACLDEYAAAQPGEFRQSGTTVYALESSGYAMGFWAACHDIIEGWNQEKQLRDMRARVEGMMATGLDEDGRPLSPEEKQRYTELLEENTDPPVITYMEGYYALNGQQIDGSLLLGLVMLAVAPLFPVERTARMEPVVLSCSRRLRLASAKMAAAGLCGLGLYALLFGGHIFVTALTYGFDSFGAGGYAWKSRWIDSGITAGGILLIYCGISLAAALASAALAAWMSGIFRRPLTALTGGVMVAAAQIIGTNIKYSTLDLSGIKLVIRRMLACMPAAVLWNNWLPDTCADALTPVLGLGLAAAACALACWLAPRCWLRLRKV